MKVDLTYSGNNWGANLGGSATITVAFDGGAAQPFATDLTGAGTVAWNPKFGGTYVFQHTAGGVTETATFKVVRFPGEIDNPWEIGADDAAAVTAYVKDGYLYLEGKGEVAAFTGDAPWAIVNDMLEGIGPLSKGIVIPASVLATLPITVEGGAEPSGAIGGAEPERIEIVGGKAYLAVSVCTNGDVTAATEDWQKAKVEAVDLDEETGEAILTVPATAEQGFMFLKSKGAVPSNRSGRPDTADIQHD